MMTCARLRNNNKVQYYRFNLVVMQHAEMDCRLLDATESLSLTWYLSVDTNKYVDGKHWNISVLWPKSNKSTITKVIGLEIFGVNHHRATVPGLDIWIIRVYCKRNSIVDESLMQTYALIYIYSGYGKYSDPLKLFTLCYIAAIC